MNPVITLTARGCADPTLSVSVRGSALLLGVRYSCCPGPDVRLSNGNASRSAIYRGISVTRTHTSRIESGRKTDNRTLCGSFLAEKPVVYDMLFAQLIFQENEDAHTELPPCMGMDSSLLDWA